MSNKISPSLSQQFIQQGEALTDCYRVILDTLGDWSTLSLSSCREVLTKQQSQSTALVGVKTPQDFVEASRSHVLPQLAVYSQYWHEVIALSNRSQQELGRLLVNLGSLGAASTSALLAART